MELLPSTVYQSPPRSSRGRPLNTIIEADETPFGFRSDSEGDASDRTIIARPTALDAVLKSRPLRRSNATMNKPYVDRSSMSSVEDEYTSNTNRCSYAESDTSTVFSEDSSCPSLADSNASDPTSFATNSSRNSIASGPSARNRYPGILIPRASWNSMDSPIKEVSYPMSPANKIQLSSSVLSTFARNTPAPIAPPSLGDGSSVCSESPCIPAMSSAPATPELHNLETEHGQSWGVLPDQLSSEQPTHSIIISSPVDVLSPIEHYHHQSVGWSDIMMTFPAIPGATPVEVTPITPNMANRHFFTNVLPDTGVQLPAEAMQVLENLTRAPSPSISSFVSGSRGEMKEHTKFSRHRPHSVDGASEYSFSQLSIPSPGGFFSSLQANARHTWCTSGTTERELPSSAVAEQYYSQEWSLPNQVKQTVLEYQKDIDTDEPPTVRQAQFNPESLESTRATDDQDMHESTGAVAKGVHVGDTTDDFFEYEAAYDEELKQAAEGSLDRTSHWLSAQNTYLAALRETNPLNDPADYSQTPKLSIEEHVDFVVSEDDNTTLFLDAARAANVVVTNSPLNSTPVSPNKEKVYLAAYEHHLSQAGQLDSFLQSSARLDSINTTRIALPELHLQRLLNQHSSLHLVPQNRPKYRGPYSQNPRATGIFNPTPEQTLFQEAEKKQLAIDRISPHIWVTEAQRQLLYQGRFFANCEIEDRLTRRSAAKLDSENVEVNSRLRILDLGGAAVASWGWAAAKKWPTVNVYTVQMKQDAGMVVRSATVNRKPDDRSAKPVNPANHHVVSVPHLWQLPFKTGYFDAISARTLHMFLHSRPVPGVESIDEWDLTLKECMRVLKPGGVLDYFVMDSGIASTAADCQGKLRKASTGFANISPSATVGQGFSKTDTTAMEFGLELKRRGYDRDGGCSKLMARLKKGGFVGLKRQWIGLPMGRMNRNPTSEIPVKSETEKPKITRSSTEPAGHTSWGWQFQADGTRKRVPFQLASRPISGTSTVSHLIDQYGDTEAVQGPIGSTADITDMSTLLGGQMWEEWLVRLRMEMGKEGAELLDGITDFFDIASGRSLKGVVGWAKKPSSKRRSAKAKSTKSTQIVNASAIAANLKAPVSLVSSGPSLVAGLSITTQGLRSNISQPLYRSLSRSYVDIPVSTTSLHSTEFTFSAVDRGEVGIIPMMIMH